MKIAQERSPCIKCLNGGPTRKYVPEQISNSRKKVAIKNTRHCYILLPLNLVVVVETRVSLIRKAKD